MCFCDIVVESNVVIFSDVVCCVFSEDGVIDVFAFPGTPGSVHCDIDVESRSSVRGGICVRGVRSKFSGIAGQPALMKPFCLFVRLALRYKCFQGGPIWRSMVRVGSRPAEPSCGGCGQLGQASRVVWHGPPELLDQLRIGM